MICMDMDGWFGMEEDGWFGMEGWFEVDGLGQRWTMDGSEWMNMDCWDGDG